MDKHPENIAGAPGETLVPVVRLGAEENGYRMESWYYRPTKPLPSFGEPAEFGNHDTRTRIEEVRLSCGGGRLARAAFWLLTRLPLVITVSLTVKEGE